MTLLKVCDLKIHPDNEYYFDDISGEKWNKLLESIKSNGVRTPIIVTDDMRIVSGNQRVRACKELGIEMINAEVVHYKSEEDIIRDLIEINVRQRGVIDDSEIKQSRRIDFLKEYYGIKRGGDRRSDKSKVQNAPLKTLDDLSEELQISKDKIKRLSKLSDMIPEMQELVETGVVSKTTALAIIKQLPEFQQKELAEQLSGSEKKVSQREVQKYIDLIAEKDRKIKELESREPEIKTVVKEVVPGDYREAKSKAKAYDAETKRLNKRLEDAYKERNYLQDRVAELEGATKEGLDTSNLSENVFYFCTICNNFIGNVGGLVWLTDRIADMPEKQRDMFLKASSSFRDWSLAFTQNLERRVNEYEQAAEFDSRVPVLTDKESRR